MARTSNGTKERTPIGAMLERCSDRHDEIAEKLGVDKSLVSRWVSGQRRPTAAQIEKLEWLYASFASAEPPPSSRPKLPPPPALDEDLDVEESDNDRLRGFIRNGIRELQADASLSGVKKAEALKKLVDAKVALDRSTGENALTLAKIVGHPEFKRAARTIIEAVAPFPEALAAVIKALEAVDA